jgi:endonuclease YncB( thermonuclease family)
VDVSGGRRARSKAQGLGPCPVGVRGFESHPPHHFTGKFGCESRWLIISLRIHYWHRGISINHKFKTFSILFIGKTLRFSGLKVLKFNSFLIEVMFIALFLTLLVSLIFVKTVWSNDNVIINEVELNPTGNDNSSTVYEWIELYNPSDASIDIGGWKISTTHGGETHIVTIPQGTILTPDSYYVYERGSQWLDNNDESVILKTNDGTIIEQTPQQSDEGNNALSWQRYPNGVGDWSFRPSTKGSSNGILPEPEPEAPSQDIFEALVVEVIDGDTFDTSEGYRIRLADIDAPEIDELGYLESTEYLELLVEDKTVILNIDSVTGTDPYGRYVCLVYVEYNSTHCLNVNQALVEGGYAVIDNYTNNEFEPNNWTLYSLTETIPEFTSWNLLLFLFVTTLCILIITKIVKFKNPNPKVNFLRVN